MNLKKEIKEKYKQRMEKITSTIEQNKIWIVVLSLIVSGIGAFADGTSSMAQKEQVKLNALQMESENQEKEPFFSIKQEYSQERKQYIYSVYNSGGEIRYNDPQIMPYLLVMKYGEDGTVKNRKFISLSGFYQYEEPNEGELISFSDKWVDTTETREIPLWIDNSEIILGNDYLMDICSKNNSSEKREYTTGEIVYQVRIEYFNCKNEEKYEDIWYGRSADLTGNTYGNNTLFMQQSLGDWMRDDIKAENSLSVNCYDKSTEEVVQECQKYVDELLGQ